MTTLREAATQALEFLEAGDFVYPTELAENLKAALAEPCPCGDRPAAQCPGEWEPGCDLGNNPEYAKRVDLAEPVQQGCDHCNSPLYAAVKCRVCGRVTEPVQEPKPVAWLYRGNLHPFDPSDWASDPATPLYAHPPQRPAEPVAYSVGRTLHWHDGKGVNDAQLYLAPPQRNPVAWDGTCMLGHCNSPAGCENSGECRAAERAHGIGGEE